MTKGFLPIVVPWGLVQRLNSLLILAQSTIPCKSNRKLRHQRFKLNQSDLSHLWRAWKHNNFHQRSLFHFSSRLKVGFNSSRHRKIQKYRHLLSLKANKMIVYRFLLTEAHFVITGEGLHLTNNSDRNSLLSKLLHQTSSPSFRDLYHLRKMPLARPLRPHLPQMYTTHQRIKWVQGSKSIKIR